MKKNFGFKIYAMLLWVSLCVCQAQAQNYDDLANATYTIDKHIPAYMRISDQISTKKNKGKATTRGRDLERILNLNEFTSAILVDTLTDIAGGFHESYKEYYKGIEVEGTRCTIHYDRNNQATNVNGNFRTIDQLAIVPAISESDALKIAIEDVGAKKYLWEEDSTVFPHGMLIIYIKDDVPSLAYKFYIDATSPQTSACLFVDAIKGTVIEKEKSINAYTASVQTRYSGLRTIEATYSSNYKLIDSSRGDGIRTHNTSGVVYNSTNSNFSTLSDYDRACLDVHWAAEKTYDFYYSKFGRNSYDNNGGKIYSYVNDTSVSGYAEWHNNNNTAWFGFWDSAYTKPAVSIDVVAHEITHGLTRATSALGSTGESGALNEGMSDVFAVCVKNMFKPEKGDTIWWKGEEGGPGIYEDLSSPGCWYYQQGGWNTGGDPHINSGVFVYWFYLIAHGGTSANTYGVSFPVQSIGMDKAIQICYLMNTSYLTSTSTYEDAKECSLLAAQALGYSDQILNQLRYAWYDVGVEKFNTIIGPLAICGATSGTYYVKNLPTDMTVTWALTVPDSYTTLSYSGTNLCTVSISQATNYVKTLRANIFKNTGGLLKTADKSLEVRIPASISPCSIMETDGSNQRNLGMLSSLNDISVPVLPSTYYYFVSDALKGLTLTAAAGTTSGCTFSPHGLGKIRLYLPNGTLRIHAVNSCDNFYMEFYTSNNLTMSIASSDNSMQISLAKKQENDINDTANPFADLIENGTNWTLEIYNSETGKFVYGQRVTGSSCSVNTSGWKSGVYLVHAIVDDKSVSEKIYLR